MFCQTEDESLFLSHPVDESLTSLRNVICYRDLKEMLYNSFALLVSLPSNSCARDSGSFSFSILDFSCSLGLLKSPRTDFRNCLLACKCS